MNNYLIDVPVLLIFFTRAETFSQVFEQVKVARPSKLYLYQDGPRAGRPDDLKKIEECRRIAENIDWNCEVHTFYQEKNKGCDPSEFIAIKWAFSFEEKCIVLEDDDVPSQSFFPYCKELLDKYENDDRINMICGMNLCGVSENVTSSYLFSRCSSIWGWASWRRVVDAWEGDYSFLDDQETMTLLQDNLDHNYHVPFHSLTDYAAGHRKTGREHYESILSCNRNLYSRLNIIPKYNLITNIGIMADSTHNVGDIRLLPKGIRRVFNMKRYEIDFPLVHPRYMVENYCHAEQHMRILAIRHPWVRRYRTIEARLYLLRSFGLRGVFNKLVKRH